MTLLWIQVASFSLQIVGGSVINNFFKIKKISDLTQVCVLPVMILSIFLAFYLYIDMGKIKDKSLELVNNAIPHVLSAQQGAINLVHLKRNVEMMTGSLDLQIARKAYVNTHILVSESVFAKSDYLQQKGSTILHDVNRLWKLRLQLDELRATVNSSLNYMDALMYLIYNEQPLLFPELDGHVNNYTDLYKQTGNIRDLKSQHKFYYRLMLERLSEDFDRVAFLKAQIAKRKAQAYSQQKAAQSSQYDSESKVILNDSLAAKNVADSKIQLQQEASLSQADNKQSATKQTDFYEAQNQDLLATDASSQNLDIYSEPSDQSAKDLEKEANLRAINQDKALQSVLDQHLGDSEAIITEEGQKQIIKDLQQNPYMHSKLSAHAGSIDATLGSHVNSLEGHNIFVGQNEFSASKNNSIIEDSEIDDSVTLNIEQVQERHNSPIFFKSREHDLKLLSLYKTELDRFETLWSLFTKLQTVFSYDTNNLANEIEALSHSFTTGETAILHGELSDISQLAAQIKPMVMMTVGFSLVGFWIVIFLLNRFIIKPLKNIARILIVFRRTKRVNVKQNEVFFAQEHVMEIREIIDILPQLFDEFSSIEKKSSDLDQRYKQLLESSKYDALTKVLNRGTLNLLVKSMGANTPANFAVLMVDIDFFKHLNDTMGHQRGDEVLFAVAQTLHNNLAKKDFVFRYGGEEFCIVLSEISPSNVFKVANRLCNTIRDMKLNNSGVPSGIVTVSIGISLVTKSAGQFRVDELISQADKALYLAKRNGRNQAVACPKAIVFGMSEEEGKPLQDDILAAEATPDADNNYLVADTTGGKASAPLLALASITNDVRRPPELQDSAVDSAGSKSQDNSSATNQSEIVDLQQTDNSVANESAKISSTNAEQADGAENVASQEQKQGLLSSLRNYVDKSKTDRGDIEQAKLKYEAQIEAEFNAEQAKLNAKLEEKMAYNVSRAPCIMSFDRFNKGKNNETQEAGKAQVSTDNESSTQQLASDIASEKISANKNEPQEYELVITTDEAGNSHEYFIGEQDGPIELTKTEAYGKKSPLESKGQDAKSSGNKAQDASLNADASLENKDKQSVDTHKALSDVSNSSDVVLTQSDNTSKVVIDHELVAVMAAVNPERGFAEDPLTSDRSIIDIRSGSVVLPTLIDIATFFPDYVIDENEFDSSKAILTEAECEMLIDIRLRQECASSPFMLKEDPRERLRSKQEVKHWSLASIFRRGKALTMSKQENTESSKTAIEQSTEAKAEQKDIAKESFVNADKQQSNDAQESAKKLNDNEQTVEQSAKDQMQVTDNDASNANKQEAIKEIPDMANLSVAQTLDMAIEQSVEQTIREHSEHKDANKEHMHDVHSDGESQNVVFQTMKDIVNTPNHELVSKMEEQSQDSEQASSSAKSQDDG